MAESSGTWRQRLIFGLMYRLKKTPWDGHALSTRLRAAAAELPRGRALDVGCGTGDASIFLASSGWEVTGVDFVETALDRARAKASAARVEPRFVRADVTKLHEAGVGDGFGLIVDQGLLHGLSDAARAAYAREVTAVAAPGARMVLGAFPRGERREPRGIDRSEIEALLGERWIVSGGAAEFGISSDRRDPIHTYDLKLR
jgi:SAM-dependent methyltransferase